MGRGGGGHSPRGRGKPLARAGVSNQPQGKKAHDKQLGPITKSLERVGVGEGAGVGVGVTELL